MKKKKKEKRNHKLRVIIIIFLTGWSVWLLFTWYITTKLPRSLTEILPVVKFPPPLIVIIFFSALLLGISALIGFIIEKILKRMEK